MDGDSRNADRSYSIGPRQSLDVIFDLLSHHRRRSALACLMEYGETVTLADLAEAVAIREHGRPITEISDDEVSAVELSLYHNHLPKLASAGVVEYEPDRTLVELSEDAARIKRVISLVPSGWGVVG